MSEAPQKRIGIMIDAFHVGGVEKIAIEQTYALTKEGADAILFVLRRTDISTHPFRQRIDQVPVVFLDDRLPSFLRVSFKIPFFSFFSLYHLTYPLLLPFVLHTREVDTFISHNTYTTLSALAFRLFRQIPFYIMLWDPIFYILQRAYTHGPLAWLKPLLLPVARFADRVMVCSATGVLVAGEPHKPYLREIGADRILTLYPGVDPAATFQEKKEGYVLCATAWKEGKKPTYNIDILADIPRMNLVLAGSWYPHELQDDLKAYATEKGVTDRVVFTGELSEDRLREYYRNAFVFLQTQDDRGFGLSALEAASQGCPMIIPEGQGVCELFEDGVDGFFTHEHDTPTLVAKLTELLDDPTKANRMGKHAWKKVVAEYSWAKHAQKLLEVIA